VSRHLEPAAVPVWGRYTHSAVREGVPGLLLDISQSPCVWGRYTHSAVREGVPGLLLDMSVSPRVCGVGTPTVLLGREFQDCYWTLVSPRVCGVGTPTVLLGREFQDFDPSYSEGTANMFPSRDGVCVGGRGVIGGGSLQAVGVPHVSAATPCPSR